MEAIIDRTPGRVTVSMSTRRWNRMLQLEEAYKLARIIKRSMKQVEAEPSMTPEEAIGMLKGVGNVTVPRRKRISSYERSLQELEEGRVYEAKDVDDLFKQCLG